MTLIYDAVVVGAGDGAGIGGAALASIEGTQAGICAAHYLDAVTEFEHARQYRPMAAHSAREKRFASALGKLHALQPPSPTLATEGTHTL